jgi:hypothetical protein
MTPDAIAARLVSAEKERDDALTMLGVYKLDRDDLKDRVKELESEVANLRDQVACATDLLQRETIVHNVLKEENAKREAWIADLDEIGRHSGKTDHREWHGKDIGWLYRGQVAYVGEEKP